MKVLFIVPYPTEGASNRYRVEQYVPYLEACGIESVVRPFVSQKFFRILYKKGHLFRKTVYFLAACVRRTGDLYRAFRSDAVFIHREACPIGPPCFEWLCSAMGKPILFDFDDAIFLPDTSLLKGAFRFLKCSWKVRHIIRMSRAVIVANRYLEAYARKYSENIWVIPTVVDTERFQMKKEFRENGSLVIGWVGTATTAAYLERVFPIFQKLAQTHHFVLRIVGSSKKVNLPGIPVENCEWSLKEDWAYYQNLDIGVHPLPDTPWARGKAAFKVIQYMAAGVPVVASPVGMNAEVIQDGVNGFLASTEEEWFQKLSQLVEQPSLRKQLAEAGRKRVEEQYTSRLYREHFLNVVKTVARGASPEKEKGTERLAMIEENRRGTA